MNYREKHQCNQNLVLVLTLFKLKTCFETGETVFFNEKKQKESHSPMKLFFVKILNKKKLLKSFSRFYFKSQKFVKCPWIHFLGLTIENIEVVFCLPTEIKAEAYNNFL